MPDYDDLHHAELPALNEGISQEADTMSRVATAMAALVIILCSAVAFAQAPLTNADVVKLVQLALGDDVVVAKIQQAAKVEFRLETDDLASLKTAGVSGRVIKAMLDKSTPVPSQPAAKSSNELLDATHALELSGRARVNGNIRVELVDSSGARSLPSQSGSTSTTHYFVGMLFWFNVHDARAAIRSADRSAYIRVYSQTRLDEVGAFVRLDSNKEDRSLKIGNMNAFKIRDEGLQVDKDWIVKSEVREVTPGVWELRPIKALSRGEFGFYVNGMQMFTFGVD